MPKIAYIQPLYHVPDKNDHVAAHKKHKEHLRAACEDMLITKELLVTFIPVGIKKEYELDHLKGKVTTLLRPIKMPDNHDMTNYNHIDSVDANNRWPYGWPFEVLCNIPEEKCLALKYIIENSNGSGTYKDWTEQFSFKKPVKLYSDESNALQKYFEPFYSF